MEYVISKRTEDCGCRRCDTYATITEWSCGCVEVEIYQDSKRCDECTDFAAKRESCGKPGRPGDDD